MNERTLIKRLRQKLEVALMYLEDGAPHTAAARIRDGLAMRTTEEAKRSRSRKIRPLKPPARCRRSQP